MSADRHSARDQDRLIHAITHHGIDVIFDVGANVGQYGQKLRKIGFDGRIVSFEPLETVHTKLENTAADDAGWTIAPAMALGDTDGQVTINRSAESDMSSALDFTDEMADLLDSSAYVAQEQVRQSRLDGVFDTYVNAGDRAMLKIDTQGFEKQVLDGAAAVLNRITLIQLELSIIEIYAGEPKWEEMCGHLASLGYQPILFIPGYFNKRSARMLQMDGVFARHK